MKVLALIAAGLVALGAVVFLSGNRAPEAWRATESPTGSGGARWFGVPGALIRPNAPAPRAEPTQAGVTALTSAEVERTGVPVLDPNSAPPGVEGPAPVFCPVAAAPAIAAAEVAASPGVVVAPEVARFQVAACPAPIFVPDVGGAPMGAPQMAAPQMGAPQMAAPQMAAPQMAAPQMGAPQMAAPQMAAPQMGAPQMAAPQMAAPQMAAPQMTAPQMTAPQMTAPQMAAPQMAATQMLAPQMAAPQMLAPQMAAPQMAAPQMLAPQMAAPQMAATQMLGAPQMAAAQMSAAPMAAAALQAAPLDIAAALQTRIGAPRPAGPPTAQQVIEDMGPAPATALDPRPFAEAHWQGLEAIPRTATLAAALRLPPDVQGVILDDVTLPADLQGFRAGDLVTAVDGVPTPNLVSFIRATDRIRDQKRVGIDLVRAGAPQRLELVALLKRLGSANGETPPMIPPGAVRPHRYMGPCVNCHRIGMTGNMAADQGDNLKNAPGPVRLTDPVKHRDRGPCAACHPILP